MPEGVGQRLFFALWPDDLCRERLMRQARNIHDCLGGRLTASDSLHLTLVFLGRLNAEQADGAERVGQRTRTQAFTLKMTEIGCWPHNRIAWMAPEATPQPLSRLVDDLRDGVRSMGVPVESRSFAPHVTLVRKAPCRPLDERPVPFEWQVSDFVLVRSRPEPDGRHYDILNRWPFEATARDPKHV